jgi:hypothetical protein
MEWGGSVDDIWNGLNSPFAIFLLSSVLVVSVTRYLDSRNAHRVEAREQYRWIVECTQRVGYVLSAWPNEESILIWDVWNINNALDGGGQNTYYHPLFKDLEEQSIDGLLTLLELGDARHSSGYAAIRKTIMMWHNLTDTGEPDIELVEDKTADQELPAQIRTYVKVPAANIERLRDLRNDLEEHHQFLESVRRQIEKAVR